MSESAARPKAVVALSGGVDCAIAALLLLERGYDLTAGRFRLRTEQDSGSIPAPDAIELARLARYRPRIPFRLIAVQEAFQSQVVDSFVAGYAAGRSGPSGVRYPLSGT